MKRRLFVTVLLVSAAMWLGPAAEAQNCNSAPTGWGGGWWQQYSAWCTACGGTPNSTYQSCTPGPNWGRTGGVPTSGAYNGLSQASYQLGTQLGLALGKLLFGSAADPQKQLQERQMMEELARREAEAQRRHQEEEAQRIAAMYNRLYSTLKLSGLPDLHLKGLGDSPGLALKLGDSGDSQAGIKGLPGIYLPGQDKPYGIPGLPGIYTGGPGEGSGLSNSKQALKTGDGSEAPAPAAVPPTETGLQIKTGDSNSAPPVQQAPIDLSKMTPQQLADVAETVSKLPPEEQQRLFAQAQNEATAQPSSAATPGQPSAPTQARSHFEAQPAAPAQTTQTPQEQSTGPGQPMMPLNADATGQLQSVAEASRAAAQAPVPEDASAKARAGFDQAVGQSTPEITISGTTPALLREPEPVPQQTHVTPPSPVAAASSSAPAVATDFRGTALTASVREIPEPSGPSRISQLSDAALQAEITRMRQRFVDMQGEFQAAPDEIEEWQAESRQAQLEAMKAAAECFSDLLKDELDELAQKDAAFEEKGQKLKQATDKLSEALRDVNTDFAKSPKGREDWLEYTRAHLQAAYDAAGEANRLRFTKYGSQFTSFAKCGTDYGLAAGSWLLARQEIDVLNASLGDKLKAQKALADYYKKLIDEQQRPMAMSQKEAGSAQPGSAATPGQPPAATPANSPIPAIAPAARTTASATASPTTSPVPAPPSTSSSAPVQIAREWAKQYLSPGSGSASPFPEDPNPPLANPLREGQKVQAALKAWDDWAIQRAAHTTNPSADKLYPADAERAALNSAAFKQYAPELLDRYNSDPAFRQSVDLRLQHTNEHLALDYYQGLADAHKAAILEYQAELEKFAASGKIEKLTPLEDQLSLYPERRVIVQAVQNRVAADEQAALAKAQAAGAATLDKEYKFVFQLIRADAK